VFLDDVPVYLGDEEDGGREEVVDHKDVEHEADEGAACLEGGAFEFIQRSLRHNRIDDKRPNTSHDFNQPLLCEHLTACKIFHRSHPQIPDHGRAYNVHDMGVLIILLYILLRLLHKVVRIEVDFTEVKEFHQ